MLASRWRWGASPRQPARSPTMPSTGSSSRSTAMTPARPASSPAHYRPACSSLALAPALQQRGQPGRGRGRGDQRRRAPLPGMQSPWGKAWPPRLASLPLLAWRRRVRRGALASTHPSCPRAPRPRLLQQQRQLRQRALVVHTARRPPAAGALRSPGRLMLQPSTRRLSPWPIRRRCSQPMRWADCRQCPRQRHAQVRWAGWRCMPIR